MKLTQLDFEPRSCIPSGQSLWCPRKFFSYPISSNLRTYLLWLLPTACVELCRIERWHWLSVQSGVHGGQRLFMSCYSLVRSHSPAKWRLLAVVYGGKVGDAEGGVIWEVGGETYHNLGDILLMAKQVRWGALIARAKLRERRHESVPWSHLILFMWREVSG